MNGWGTTDDVAVYPFIRYLSVDRRTGQLKHCPELASFLLRWYT